MTITHAEYVLKSRGFDMDDIEAYLFGPDQPEDYFDSISTTGELLTDFQNFCNG